MFKFSQVKWLAVAATYSLFACSTAWADDIEIYQSAGTTGELTPNILFIMDTSGSMSAEVSNGEDRLDVVRKALLQILDKTSNVNVGLMRFSAANGNTPNGGPILYPIKGIDSAVVPDIVGQVGSTNDDAYQEVLSGNMVLDSAELDFSDKSVCNPCSYKQTTLSESDNLEQNGDNDGYTNFSYVSMGGAGEAHGFRFQNLSIPQGAIITEARIVWTMRDNSSYSSLHSESLSLKIQIEDEDTGNAKLFASGDKLEDRDWTDKSVIWHGLPNNVSGQKLVSPDLAGLLQDLVNGNDWPDDNSGDVVFKVTHESGDGVRDLHSHKSAGSNAQLRPTLVYSLQQNTVETVVGLRFDELNVPQGAKITSAVIEMTAADTNSVKGNFTIQGEASDDAAPFTSNNGDISARPMVGAFKSWNPNPWNVSGITYQTANITNVVQDIVNQPGWCGGNAMAFKISGNKSLRSIYSFDSPQAQREEHMIPRIRIRFDGGQAAGCYRDTFVRRVLGNNHDIEQMGNDKIKTGQAHLDMPYRPTGNNKYQRTAAIGLLFEDIDIPKTATIASAKLSVHAQRWSAADAAVATIKGLKKYPLTSFGTGNGSLTAIATTVAQSTWSINEKWQQDKQYETGDLTAVIEEIMSDSAWNQGDNIGLVISSNTLSDHAFKSHNAEPGEAPLLVIDYTANYQPGGVKVKDTLKALVNDFTHNGHTPISGTMLEAAHYYLGKQVHYGLERGRTRDSRFSVSHRDSYIGANSILPDGCSGSTSKAAQCEDEYIPEPATYITPIEQPCQPSHIVLLSDGAPNSHYKEQAELIEAITGNSCKTGDSGKECTINLAKYLFENDISDSIPGKQNVTTHTIGFNLKSQFLKDVAIAGGSGDEGEGYYEADDVEDLVKAFQSIVNQALKTTTTFTSAAVSVSQSNRLLHNDKLYFALFTPQGSEVWPGNLKKYRFLNGQVVDQNGSPVVSNDAIKETAKSYWTPLEDPQIDGNQVDAGGAAMRLTDQRKVFSNIQPNPPYDLADVGEQNRVDPSNTNITEEDLGVAGQPTAAARRVELLTWASGEDPKNGETRRSWGDPLHSRPTLMSYKDGATVKEVVFIGTNEGYLHAIDTEHGDEFWSFIPFDLLEKLETFFENQDTYSRVYGLDGSPALYLDDKNKDGVIDKEAGDRAFLYVGMRRGGNKYYALEVTDLSAPKYLFTIDGDSSEYGNLGQSWSKPQVGMMKIGGVDKPVLVFGGGYDDASQDVLDEAAPNPDGTGNTIYIADALTGAKIWDAKVNAKEAYPNALSGMTNSFPGEVAAVQIRGSGYIEHIYAADTAGQIFRFDINEENTGASDLATGAMLADVQDASTKQANRRFYATPDLSIVLRPRNRSFLSVAIGSGYRAHPLDKEIVDHFYVFRDEKVLAPNPTFDSAPYTISDLVDVTNRADKDDNVIGDIESNGKKGWYISFGKPGEKVLDRSITFNGRVLFTTYFPVESENENCTPAGVSRAYAMSIADGKPVLDVNNDGTVDELDRVLPGEYNGIVPGPQTIATQEDGRIVQDLLGGMNNLCEGIDCLGQEAAEFQTFKWEEAGSRSEPKN